MKKIKLNDFENQVIGPDGYALDPTERYVIDINDEMESQQAFIAAFKTVGAPPALKNYHAWLFDNGFSVEMPNPTNEMVAPYYGTKSLWKTKYSQGIVVKSTDDEDDYFIVMECSRENTGYKHSQIILTLFGCL